MVNKILSQILLYLSDFSNWVQNYTGDFSLPELKYDWLIIFFFIFIVLIVAVSLGRTRMLLALISLYITAFLEQQFIWLDELREIDFFQGKTDFWLHITLFFVIYFVVFAILSRSLLKQRFILKEASLPSVLGIAFFEMGFLAALIISYFPPEFIERIPSQALPYFATKTALFVWAVLPLLVLLAFKRKKTKLDE